MERGENSRRRTGGNAPVADRTAPNAKRGRCCHRPHLRFRPGPFDPGRFPIGFCKSKLQQGPIRDSSKQAPRHPFRLHTASRASVCRTSFRQAGDHPRTSFRQAGDCPFRLFPTGRTRYPDLQFLSGQALRFPSGLPSSKLSRRPFAIPLPESSGLAGLRKSGFGFGFPRCLALLPGCPTRASLASFPKDLRSLGTGGVWSFVPVAGWSLLTARGQNVRPDRFAQRESWAFCLWITWITGTSGPIPRQSADSSRVNRPRSSSQPIRIAQSACVP